MYITHFVILLKISSKQLCEMTLLNRSSVSPCLFCYKRMSHRDMEQMHFSNPLERKCLGRESCLWKNCWEEKQLRLFSIFSQHLYGIRLPIYPSHNLALKKKSCWDFITFLFEHAFLPYAIFSYPK